VEDNWGNVGPLKSPFKKHYMTTLKKH